MTVDTTYYVTCQLVREKAEDYLQGVTINNPEQVADLFRRRYGEPDREYLVAFYLDTKNKVNAISTVSIGSVDRTTASPLEIFRPAFLTGAASLILVHNHPSGDPEPSEHDYELTQNLEKVARLLNIRLLDHVVVGSDSHCSICEEKPFMFMGPAELFSKLFAD